jgi:helix-turn-helix, Psq domain/Tc5 transposase DNA-binding domain
MHLHTKSCYFFVDMPYKNSQYVRKTHRGSWLEENMESAISRVHAGEMSIGEASRYHDVPKSTLGRRLLDKNKVAKGSVKFLGRFQTTFDTQFEDELVQYVTDLEGRFFGITYMDLRELAFQLAVKNNLHHQFNTEKDVAGKKWVRLFMKRHPSLSLRQPEATSYARATGFNKPAVDKIVSLLTEIVDKYKLDGSRIYNCDESGMKTVQQQHSKVIAAKGKNKLGP